MRTLFTAASLSLLFITGPAQGHEFWIDPVKFFVDAGEPIRADLRVGENYKGAASPYLPSRFRLFEMAQGEKRIPVNGTLGDRPAVKHPARDGLTVILHETTDSTLNYAEMAKFEKFVTHKDAGWVLDRHKERGLPESDFNELYSRYAKSLIAVGSAQGQDREYGLLTELVALNNPYTDDLARGMSVRVLYQGQPRQNAQVEVFERAPGGTVRVFTVRSNGSGVARVPVRAGHRYMLDSVVLREPSAAVAKQRRVVWESLWANLTFEVPQ